MLRLRLWSLAASGLLISCSRKPEIIPAGAGHVSRTDTTVQTAAETYTGREYSFDMTSAAGSVRFVCESRRYAEEAQAAAAAKKAIAQRPDAQQQRDHAWYAAAGKSVWLWNRLTLNWCMLVDGPEAARPAALKNLRDEFMKKYEVH